MLTGKTLTKFSETIALLNCRRLLGRLNTTEAAALLGFHEHDIAPLVAARMLTPLGKPAPNAPKYFASVDLLTRIESAVWLSDATKALAKHWTTKNSRKRTAAEQGIGPERCLAQSP